MVLGRANASAPDGRRRRDDPAVVPRSDGSPGAWHGRTMERALQCREDTTGILVDVTEAAAGCRADKAKKTAKGEAFDLAGCIQRPADKATERIANLLAKVLDKGVTPDLCLPGVCTSTTTSFACASDAVAKAAGL